MNPNDYKKCCKLLGKAKDNKSPLEERFNALSELTGYLLDNVQVNYRHPDYLAEEG